MSWANSLRVGTPASQMRVIFVTLHLGLVSPVDIGAFPKRLSGLAT